MDFDSGAESEFSSRDSHDSQADRAVQENALLDDLFILKRSLVDGDRPSAMAPSYLQQILNLIEDYPAHAQCLYKWGFLSREALYCLRTPCLSALTIRLIAQILQTVKALPDLYYTKDFLFFITEKLYHSLVAEKRPGARSSEHTVPAGDVFRLVTEMLSISKGPLNALHSIGFFVLANSVVSYEVCTLYSTVFKDLSHYTWLARQARNGFRPEVFYEIKRNDFDSEVVFREKDMITLKRPTLKYAKGIYARIYNECTNIRHLLELSVRDSLDLALYKRLIFMNEELDLLVRDKNAKAVRAYRRGLEEGGIPEKGLMLALLQALEHKDTRLDAAVALYYHADGLSEAKNFTEARIRCLFECLEHMCELECDVGRFKAPGATAGTASVQNVDRSDSAAGSLREIATCALYTQSDLNPSGGASNFEAPADIPRDGGVNFFKPLIGSESVQDTQQSLPEVRFNINRCNRTRVVRLLAQLYEACDHRYFYKPSYLILLRAQREHCSGESAFMERFYREFLMHTVSSRAALAKLLFPVGAQTRALRAVFNAQAERMQEELEADLGGDVWAGALLHGAAAAESPQLGVYNVCGEYEAEEGAGLSEKIKRMKAASSVQAGENRLNVFRGMIMSESAEEDGPADTHKSSDAAQPSNNLTIPTDQVLNTSLLKDLTSPPDESDFDRR